MDTHVSAAPLTSRHYGSVNWLGLQTLIQREIKRFMKVGAQTVFAPLVQTLGLIERNDVGNVVIVHLDQEPLFLYPELDDRGWSHEVIASSCGDPSCEDEVRLRLVRMSA